MAAVSDRHPYPPPQDLDLISGWCAGSGSANADEAPKLSLQQLRDAIEELKQREMKYMDQLYRMKKKEKMQRTDMVIDFINEVYYADQYWELKQFLTALPYFVEPDSSSDAVFDAYLKKLDESGNKFELDEKDIWHGVHIHIVELEGQTILNRLTQKRESELMELYAKKETYTAAEQRFVPPYQRFVPHVQFKPRTDTYALSNPVWNLVLQARKKECMMDTDPRLELGKIESFIPVRYFQHEIDQNSPREYKEITVMLANVTPQTTVWDVEKLLSWCGKILFSKLQSWRGKPRTVYVTFKDPRGAKKALKKESLNVRGREILIRRPEPASAPVKSNDVRVVSDDDPVAKDAFDKYRKLVARFAQQSNDVKDDVTCGEGAGSIAVSTKNAKKGVESNKKHTDNIGAGSSTINTENAKKGVESTKRTRTRTRFS